MVPQLTSLPEHVRDAIDSVVEGWYPLGRVDWEDLLWRVESHADYDFGNDMLSDEIKSVKKYVKRVREELNE